MADRTSARIFGTVFEYLAKQPKTRSRDAFVKEMWRAQREYDFSTYQMDADPALIKLGLAKEGKDPEYPDEERVLYKGEDY